MGEFRAPKTRVRDDGTRPEYYWFCLEHVREYNAKWDYFKGLTEAEALHFQKEAVHGHRPTWKTTDRVAKNVQKLREAVERFSGGFSHFGTQKKERSESRPISSEEKRSMETLGLSYPVTLKEIKRRYKELVKQYHPDLSEDKAHAEERFKDISQAYHYLAKSGLFQ